MNTNSHPVLFFILVCCYLIVGYLVFRRIVRQEYRKQGKLSWWSSSLQLLVLAGLMAFPFLFNPPEWPWFWMLAGPTSRLQQVCGLLVILLGFGVSFGTMAWFGMRRAFGIEVKGIVLEGPYRFTRNPQVLGGYLLVIGVSLQWPSWYALLWIALYGITMHWMILSEEEHLLAIFGEEYKRLCDQTPRYLFMIK